MRMKKKRRGKLAGGVLFAQGNARVHSEHIKFHFRVEFTDFLDYKLGHIKLYG